MSQTVEPRRLGRRIASAHRTAAAVLLNTILLIVMLEVSAAAFLAVLTSQIVRDTLFRTTG